MANAPAAPKNEPLLFNELGVNAIDIGVTAFHCMGVKPPHDHPHVYLNMGQDAEILCPYCSTKYRFDSALGWNQTVPRNCSAAH